MRSSIEVDVKERDRRRKNKDQIARGGMRYKNWKDKERIRSKDVGRVTLRDERDVERSE